MRILSDGKITEMHRPKWLIAFIKLKQQQKQIKNINVQLIAKCIIRNKHFF